jgi:CDP-diacylglycerol--glycerol-3-phosphate 3-phosphatidyltransferase
MVRRRILAEIWNLPNLLTLGRIVLIPAFLMVLHQGSRLASFVAASLFIVAGLTDVVDGFLARRLGLITVVGKFLDPIADKLLVMSALVMLLAMGRVPAWVVIVILARDLVISALRTLAMSEGVVIAAGQGGKWKTSLQVVGLIGLILHFPYRIDFLLFEVDLDLHRVGIWILYLSLVPGILSAFDYLRSFFERMAEEGPVAGGRRGA